MATKDEAQRFSETVAAQVRAEISARSESVASIAREIGINRETLNRWVKGERPFAVGTLFQVANALGMDTYLLVQRAEQRFDEEYGRVAPLFSLNEQRAKNVGGSVQNVPENVEEAWAGKIAAHDDTEEPIDHDN